MFQFDVSLSGLLEGLPLLRRSTQIPAVPHRPQHPFSTKCTLKFNNRMGETYFLQGGRTKGAKARYFVAQTVRPGSLAAMPKGFELCESLNGVVSVRRIGTSGPTLPQTDLNLVLTELARHSHLREYRVEEVKGEIVVFEPAAGTSDELIAEFSRELGLPPDGLKRRIER